MKQTKVERMADKLAAIGYRETSSPSRKYRKFTRNEHTLWLGKCGAVRSGRTVGESISLSPR